jgi:hypothetical protein
LAGFTNQAREKGRSLFKHYKEEKIMHLKDYKVIAKVLRQAKKETKGVLEPEATTNTIIDYFCISLKEENHSFNEQKFRDYIEKGE